MCKMVRAGALGFVSASLPRLPAPCRAVVCEHRHACSARAAHLRRTGAPLLAAGTPMFCSSRRMRLPGRACYHGTHCPLPHSPIKPLCPQPCCLPPCRLQHKYFVLGGEFGTGGRACLKLPPHEQASPSSAGRAFAADKAAPAYVHLAPCAASTSRLLAPPCNPQVMNRCPCTAKDECGELERLVTELAAAGQLPPFPVQEGSLEAATGGSSISNW